jgi:hypothetical protein
MSANERRGRQLLRTPETVHRALAMAAAGVSLKAVSSFVRHDLDGVEDARGAERPQRPVA